MSVALDLGNAREAVTFCAKISSGSVDRSPLSLSLGPSFSLQCVLNVSVTTLKAVSGDHVWLLTLPLVPALELFPALWSVAVPF